MHFKGETCNTSSIYWAAVQMQTSDDGAIVQDVERDWLGDDEIKAVCYDQNVGKEKWCLRTVLHNKTTVPLTYVCLTPFWISELMLGINRSQLIIF